GRGAGYLLYMLGMRKRLEGAEKPATHLCVNETAALGPKYGFYRAGHAPLAASRHEMLMYRPCGLVTNSPAWSKRNVGSTYLKHVTASHEFTYCHSNCGMKRRRDT